MRRVWWGLVAGVVSATSVSWFVGTVYREGILFAPLAAFLLATATPFVFYEEPAKRMFFALLTSTLLSGFSLLAIGLGGQATGTTMFGLGVAAVAIPVGIDLVLQDLGTQSTIHPLFARGAAAAFLVAVLPVSSWIIVHAHSTAMKEDKALIQTVAQNISPQGTTLVFDQIDPRQKEKLTNLVSVRTREKTYRLADAEIETVIEHHPARREHRTPNQHAVVSREQEDWMRIILNLQDAPLPEDIVLFSQRGPITISELTVSLDKKNPG